MTREQTIEAIKVMQAFVDRKEVECKYSYGWERVDQPNWNWADLDFRIEPTKTLRPWTADEVPLGAWMRSKESNEPRFLITQTRDQYYRIQLMSEYEHSLDGGKTWLPCGVEEESK